MRSSQERWTADSDSAHDRLATLGLKITAAVEELLILVIGRLRVVRDKQQLSTEDGSSADSFYATIAFALDYVGLETSVRNCARRFVSYQSSSCLTLIATTHNAES